jgi:hypothetical protein
MSLKTVTVLASFLALGLPLSAPAFANPQAPAASSCPSATSPSQSSQFPESDFVDESFPNQQPDRFHRRDSAVQRLPTAIRDFPFPTQPSEDILPLTYTPPRTLDEIQPQWITN